MRGGHDGATIIDIVNKAFTKETDTDDDDDVEAVSPLPAGARNYMTPGGFARLSAELERLVQKERPELVATVAWAASNGDRSENGDYIYGKKRLREIDRRMRFLGKRLDIAIVVDPKERRGDASRVFFGATVVLEDQEGREQEYQLVGEDEIDAERRRISWRSPIGTRLLGRSVDDEVRVETPAGMRSFTVIDVRYE